MSLASRNLLPNASSSADPSPALCFTTGTWMKSEGWPVSTRPMNPSTPCVPTAVGGSSPRWAPSCWRSVGSRTSTLTGTSAGCREARPSPPRRGGVLRSQVYRPTRRQFRRRNRGRPHGTPLRTKQPSRRELSVALLKPVAFLLKPSALLLGFGVVVRSERLGRPGSHEYAPDAQGPP